MLGIKVSDQGDRSYGGKQEGVNYLLTHLFTVPLWLYSVLISRLLGPGVLTLIHCFVTTPCDLTYVRSEHSGLSILKWRTLTLKEQMALVQAAKAFKSKEGGVQ